MRLKLVPDETHFGFMAVRRWAVGISSALVIGSLIAVIVMGLNFGIDFRGGTVLMAETDQKPDIAAYRDVLGGLGVGDVSVTAISDPAAAMTGEQRNAVMIRIEQQAGDDAIQADAIATTTAALKATIPTVRILSTESVGAKVSGELVIAGILAVLLSVGAVLFYIWLRFEWQFALGAVVALVHDVALTIGVFAAFQLQFNLSIIAALLTIVGYSLNDTVVVFDRVRENLRKYKKMPLSELLDLSINETLSRTLMTAGTTLVALVALYLLGGEVIRGFTFAMIWGIVVGTYSSIFIASVLLLRLGVTRETAPAATEGGVQFGAANAP